MLQPATHRLSLLFWAPSENSLQGDIKIFEHTQVFLHNPKWAKAQPQPNSK